MTVAELRARLRGGSAPERLRLLAKVLRESRDHEVWRFTTPREVVRLWPGLARHLGRRRRFWEFLLDQWRSQGLLDDHVRERAEQISPEKPLVGGIRLDPPAEILANKLCTLLSRAEIRDLVDVRALEAIGFAVEVAVPVARRKDGGLTPAQLAFVLSEISIGDDAPVPGGVRVPELRSYLASLVARLSRLALPPPTA